MKMPRVPTLIITGQFILLLICLGFLGYVLVNNYCLKFEAKRYATTAGLEQATRDFSRGDYSLYETKFFKFSDEGLVPTDGDIEPSGKTDGQFRIYYFLVGQEGWEKGHQEIQQAYIDATTNACTYFLNIQNGLIKMVGVFQCTNYKNKRQIQRVNKPLNFSRSFV